MYVLQSNGYISEDSFIWFEEILHLIGRCLVRCRDCLCNVFLPSRSIVLSTLMHIYMLEKKKKNTDWSKWRDIFSREVAFCKGMLPIEKGILLLLKECYTLWMKVSVCKACSCHLELVKGRMHVWSSLVVIYSVFTAIFRFGEKTQSWRIFFIWVESLLKGNFAERLRYLEVRKLYLRHSLEGVRAKRS